MYIYTEAKYITIEMHMYTETIIHYNKNIHLQRKCTFTHWLSYITIEMYIYTETTIHYYRNIHLHRGYHTLLKKYMGASFA